jgi:hypothetical protein
MSAFKLSLLIFAVMAITTANSLWPASAEPRAISITQTQSAGGAKQVGYRYRYGYHPYYRRYGYYQPRPYYGYPLDFETYSVWRNKRPEWFDY